MRRNQRQTRSPYVIPRPTSRRLWIYSIDPSLAQSLDTHSIRTARIDIPWEDTVVGEELYGGVQEESERRDALLTPGPCGEYLEVIDYDPATKTYYKPIDLSDPYLLAQDGLAPSDGNPQFHQEMVYVVCMRTIRNIEVALGRRALWASKEGQQVGRLRV
jgi:hypothetical protein